MASSRRKITFFFFLKKTEIPTLRSPNNQTIETKLLRSKSRRIRTFLYQLRAPSDTCSRYNIYNSANGKNDRLKILFLWSLERNGVFCVFVFGDVGGVTGRTARILIIPRVDDSTCERVQLERSPDKGARDRRNPLARRYTGKKTETETFIVCLSRQRRFRVCYSCDIR